MGQRGTKVVPITDDDVNEQHLGASRNPSTNMDVEDLHPRGENPVGAEGEETRTEEGENKKKKKRKSKKWWQRLRTLFRAAKKPLPEVSLCQQQQEEEEEEEKQQKEEEEEQQQEEQQKEEEEEEQQQEEEEEQQQEEEEEKQQMEEEEEQQQEEQQKEEKEEEEEDEEEEEEEEEEVEEEEEEEEDEEEEEEEEDEGEKMKLIRAARSSDDYIFSRYSIGGQLGKGGFGVVYEGTRLDDGLTVALKYVTKTAHMECITIPDHPNPLPKEIALTIMANKGPSVPQIVKLLDWLDCPDHFVMVLECPSPCVNLADFLRRHGGTIDEKTARHIMLQAVHAAYTCCLRRVFHRDIKLGNLLINTETSQVKLIDFGCGDIMRWSPYTSYQGTTLYSPPEFNTEGKYYGRQATVFSLGMLMFVLLFGRFPFDFDMQLFANKQWALIQPRLSKECCCLLRELLHPEWMARINLGEILCHNWFKNWPG